MKGFQPTVVKGKVLSSLLSKAHTAVENFNAQLKQSENPLLFLTPLSFGEALVSLSPHRKRISLKKTLLHDGDGTAIEAEILRYERAVKEACSKKKNAKFSHRWICEMHKQLKSSIAHPTDVGRYRNRQNWIGPANRTIDEAYYLPPKHTQVRKLMHSLLDWGNTSTREDPLISTALLFAQLLIIHPFMDGNGRIARILVPLSLFRKGAILAPLLFVSRYFQSLRLAYYQNLYAITENASWEKWVCFFLKGIIACAKKQAQALSSLIALRESLPEMPANTLHMLFENPVFTKSHFKKNKGTDALLSELVRCQCVEKWKGGKFVFKSLVRTIEKTSKS